MAHGADPMSIEHFCKSIDSSFEGLGRVSGFARLVGLESWDGSAFLFDLARTYARWIARCVLRVDCYTTFLNG